MTTEERIERMEKNLHSLVVVQDQMMDLLGMTVEGERRLATRMEEIEELRRQTDRTLAKIVVTLAETDEKLNALIGVVDGFIRGKG
jgi:sigma54-dependent transcription regulator